MPLDKTNTVSGPATLSAAATWTTPLFVPAGANYEVDVTGTAGSTITVQKCPGADEPADASFIDVASFTDYNISQPFIESVGSWIRAGIKTNNYVTNAVITLRRSADGVGSGVSFAAQLANRLAPTPQLSVSSASKTRPSDTTTYAAGDVVNESTSAGTTFAFAGMARFAGGSGTIAEVLVDDSANVTVKALYELWLFSTAVTADNDNAVFTPTDAEMQTLVCAPISIATPYIGDATSGAGGNAILSSGVINVPYVCATGSTSLVGVIVVRNAYVPVSAEVINVRIKTYLD